mgnify:CR=1 FL=1
MKYCFLIVAALAFSLCSTNCAVINADVKNSKGETIADIIEGNKLRFFNLHREKKPTLKLSLTGATFEKVANQSSTSWQLTLKDTSQLKLSEEVVINSKGNVSHYYVHWQSGSHSPVKSREVCFFYGENGAHWYGGYQGVNVSWPMDTQRHIPKQQFGFLFDADSLNDRGDPAKEHLMVLEQLFVVSDGFALLLDHQAPWFIRRLTVEGSPLMCLSVAASAPYFTAGKDSTYLDLKFHVFASNNIKTVSAYVTHQSGLIAKPSQLPDKSLFTSPTWFGHAISQMNVGLKVREFTAKLKQNHFPVNNKIIVIGYDLKALDHLLLAIAFPDKELVQTVNNGSNQIGLQFYRPNFGNHTLLKKYSINGTSEFIDFSIGNASSLIQTQLFHVKSEKKLDVLHFSGIRQKLTNFAFHNSTVERYPGLYTTRYIETVSKVGGPIITEFAYRSQHLPVWTRLTNYNSTTYDQLLRDLIPNLLSVSLSGYSFVLPYSAGGIYGFTKGAPKEELFIRMLQAITFMPAISFGRAPWAYSDRAVNISKALLNLHAEHASVMIALAENRLKTGEPIIRPLWYAEPEDARAYRVNDQFLLGEDILVAPVVVRGQRERTVYFPRGTWIDQHGKEYSGQTIVKVAAPLNELLYFKRKH